MLLQDSFIFGRDLFPFWFNKLVECGKVEWVNEYGRIKGCFCINKTGVTLAKMIGDVIIADELFQSEEEVLEYCKGGETNED